MQIIKRNLCQYKTSYNPLFSDTMLKCLKVANNQSVKSKK